MFIVFNATFNNISVISWQSDLLVEETGVPGEKPPTCFIKRLEANQFKSLWEQEMCSTLPAAGASEFVVRSDDNGHIFRVNSKDTQY